MKNILHFRLDRPVGSVIICLACSLAYAQEGSINQAEGKPELPTSRMDITPMSAPLPAMKYELLPKAIDRRPGNAAVHYGKVKSEQNNFFSSSDIHKKIETAQVTPLSDLKNNNEFDFLIHMDSIYSSLQRGARSQEVDWQLPLRDQFFANILLPETQESRTFARLLQGRARVQLARGDFDGAVDTLQTGFGLARHVGEGQTLINGLVGLVMIQIMLDTVQELIAQPNAPNMYWALATLPAPLADLRPGMESEQFALYWTEPAWLRPEKMEGDEHFWRRELNRLWTLIKGMSDDRSDDTILTAYIVRGYPAAKPRLIQRGFKPDEVEKMPVAQVVLLDVLHQYNCNRDAEYVRAVQALSEPTIPAQLPQDQALSSSPGKQEYPESLPISKQLGLVSYGSIIKSVKRLERHLAVLQVVEALRMHAAKTGKLPSRLDEVTLVHVPDDPTTSKPFEYEFQDDLAVISSPHLNVPVRLEIRLSNH